MPSNAAQSENKESMDQCTIIRVDMDIRYAKAATRALDLFVRLGLGQVSAIYEMVRCGLLPFNVDGRGSPHSEAQIDEAVELLSKALGFYSEKDRNLGGYGIGSRQVDSDVHPAYELFKVIGKAVADNVNPNPKLKTVAHDGLIARYTLLPSPSAYVLSNQCRDQNQ